MPRPDARDNDAMGTLLQTIKDQVKELAGRLSLPVGKLWRIEEHADGDLVATLPAQNRSVVLASPNGECGAPLDCVGRSLDDTLTYDKPGRKIGAHISVDDGNALTTGGDGGLFVGASNETSGEAVFAGPFLVAAQRGDGDAVDSSDDEDFDGVWTYPDHDWAAPFRPGELPDEFYNAGAWRDIGRTSYYSTDHAHPDTGFSIHFPGYTAPSNTSTSNKYSGVAWYLQAWDEWYPPWLARPDWCGDYVEADFTYRFAGGAGIVAVPGGGPGEMQPVPVCLFNFWPGASLYLRGSDLYAAGEASWWSPAGENDHVMSFESSYPTYDAATGTWERGGGGNPVTTGELVRFRVRLSRSGFSGAYMYIGDVDRPDDHYDTYVSFGDRPINFEQTLASGIAFEFGPQFAPKRFGVPYEWPTPYPSFDMPDMWLSNIKLKVGLPANTYWPPHPT
jgi:hypothetical protein